MRVVLQRAACVILGAELIHCKFNVVLVASCWAVAGYDGQSMVGGYIFLAPSCVLGACAAFIERRDHPSHINMSRLDMTGRCVS